MEGAQDSSTGSEILRCLLVACPWSDRGGGNWSRTANKDRIISISLPFAFEFQLMFLNLKKYFICFNL